MKKSFLVIGLGSFGQSVATTLYSLGHEVLGIDMNEDIVQMISNNVTYAVEGDCRDESILRSLGVRNFDVAVVTIGQDMESSILITVTLKDLGVEYVVAKARNAIHAKILSKVGADKVIFPERDMGYRVAHSLSDSNFVDFLELSDNYSVVEINCPQIWIGKRICEMDIRGKYGLNILAIKNGNDINISPDPQDVFTEKDVLIVIGANDDLNKLV